MNPKRLQIELASATIPGMHHILPGKPKWQNNQDAMAVLQDEKTAIAVICDGCGSGNFSELGARLCANQLLEILTTVIGNEPSPAMLDWEMIRYQIITRLNFIALTMGKNLQEVILQNFLFTIIGFIITQEETTIFHLGDGVVWRDGQVQNYGPFPGNAPPYLMYAITGSPLFDTNPNLAHFQIENHPTDTINNLAIGTDGMEDLIQLANKHYPGTEEIIGPLDHLFTDAFFQNPDRLRRHLARVNRER